MKKQTTGVMGLVLAGGAALILAGAPASTQGSFRTGSPISAYPTARTSSPSKPRPTGA